MANKRSSECGAAMLLTICVFAILIVLGMNVLSACMSNMDQIKTKYEKQQTRLSITSIYETVNDMILDTSNLKMQNCILQVMTKNKNITGTFQLEDITANDITVSLQLKRLNPTLLEIIITVNHTSRNYTYEITSNYMVTCQPTDPEDPDSDPEIISITNKPTTKIIKK